MTRARVLSVLTSVLGLGLALVVITGRPNGLPSTVQRQVTAPIDICGECAACQIAIETAFRTDFQEGEKE